MDAVRIQFEKYDKIAEESFFVKKGKIVNVVGLTIESAGPDSKLGDICYIFPEDKTKRPIMGETAAKKADFYTNHNCIEELYNLIDEEQDLEQYFEYNGIEFLSAKLPNLDIKNIKYQYIEFDKDYKRLKRYFEFIVHTYMSALTHKADYTKELTDPERNFIEFVFDFSYNYKGSIDKLKNDHWEIIHIEERTLLLEYMDKMCELDINILNKYIGASTTQEFETRFEDLRMKLLNPVSYRIFNAIRDIQAELPMNKTIEDIVADDIDGYREETCRIKEIEQKLLSVKSNIIDINKREDYNSILSYIYNSLEL